jgi:hypothetical protein
MASAMALGRVLQRIPRRPLPILAPRLAVQPPPAAASSRSMTTVSNKVILASSFVLEAGRITYRDRLQFLFSSFSLIKTICVRMCGKL